MAKHHIEVWLDRTSDYERPAWIVSLEHNDSSNTLAIFNGDGAAAYEAAMERANEEARNHDCNLVVERDRH